MLQILDFGKVGKEMTSEARPRIVGLFLDLSKFPHDQGNRNELRVLMRSLRGLPSPTHDKMLVDVAKVSLYQFHVTKARDPKS